MDNKQKLILMCAVLAVVMLACGTSNNQPGNQDTDQEDISLETMVALTLAADEDLEAMVEMTLTAGGESLPVDEIVAQTVAALETADAEAGGGSDPGEPPADTPDPPPPTATQEPTPTHTESATATLFPDDPKTTLGSPNWSVDFDSTYDWNTYTDPKHKAEIKNGKLIFTIYGPVYGARWTFAAPKINKYYLEITAMTTNECNGTDRYGLIFGTPASKYDEGYLFQVSCDGRFRLGLYDSGGSWTNLINWTVDSAIQAGPNQTNVIGVLKQGEAIALYVNGKLVGNTTDSTYTGEGKFGVAIATDGDLTFQVKFDQAAYWILP